MKKLFTLILLAALLSSLQAAVKNVPSQYTTIQSGINAAVDGDTVLVAPGTYFENIHFRGKNIVVTSAFYQTFNLSIIGSTIINGSTPSNSDSGSCVRIVSNNNDSLAVLQGFTITGGIGTFWQDEHGAGRYCEGGGIIMQYSRATVQFNIVKDNKAIRRPAGIASTGGGGIRMGDGRAKIFNNIIFNNEAMYGGGVVLNYSNTQLKNNVIFNNRVYQAVAGAPTYGGGGVWTNGTGISTVENNTIVNNSSFGTGTTVSGRGGGIHVNGANTTITNNIVWGNTAATGAIELKQISGASVVTYTCVQNGLSGTGNISTNPLFDSTNYIISSASPCIDAGNPASNYNDVEGAVTGQAGFPSRGTLRNDMGAYGGPLSKLIANSLVGIYEPVNIVSSFELKQNYPNPFNPATKISYQIADAGFASLKIFDATGKEIVELVKGVHAQGNYSVNFDAGKYNLASGVYFYKLTLGARSVTKAMLLLK
jgi:hypothetical protein